MATVTEISTQKTTQTPAQIEERNIQTVNDQITTNENQIESDLHTIDMLHDKIRELRRDIAARRKINTTLRKKRAVFARAAFDLKEIDQP
jgi:hypothetical protein